MKLNVLVAYPYWRKPIIDAMRAMPKEDRRLIVDSGAFTAWNTGKPIHLDDYCRFLDSIEDLRPFHAVQLDVFGDPEASYKNLLIMRERGYDVMPVFTRGESLERLEEFYEMTDYIMFGGIVIGGKNREYVKWWLNRNQGRKAHWLGFVNIPFIKRYKPESVDSSSWNSASRFGNVSVWDGRYGIKTIHKKVFAQRPPDNVIHSMLKVGATPRMIQNLAKSDAWIANGRSQHITQGDETHLKSTAQFISTLSHIKRAFKIEQDFGTKVYLAGEASWTVFLIETFYYGRQRGIW